MTICAPMSWVPARTVVSSPRRWELRPTGSSLSGGRPPTSTTPGTAEFEVLLTEGSDTLSVIYGASDNNGAEAASGIQQDLTLFTSFSCFEAVLTPGLRVNYIPTGCPTPTPTATPTVTPDPTPTPTPCTGRCTPTPRPRPTPAPRP